MNQLLSRLCLMAALTALTAPADAALRSAAEARAIAMAALTDGTDGSDIRLRLDQPAPADTRSASDHMPYYIFNNEGDKGGFAIIAASDLIQPVLAMDDHGHIPTGHMPDNLAGWLRWIADATAYLEQHPEASLLAETAAGTATTPIAPLLQGIAWAQGAPFNDLCPGQCPAGCVATALAQVVYYYRYPQHGQGGVLDYTSASGLHQSIDFSKQSYDYDLMFDSHDEKDRHTSAQLQEVAQLSYHCGLLAHMDYKRDESGAHEFHIPYSMSTYMGYDPKAQCLERALYTYEEWNDLMLTELKARRPVIYCGASSSGGHCFVLDGINSDGLYHVNWGWAGAANGYYNISILKPSAYGIGATDAADGFVAGQTAVVQLAPTVKEGRYFAPIHGADQITSLTSTTTAGSKTGLSLSSVFNLSPIDVTGSFGVAFMKEGSMAARAQLTLSTGRPAPTTATFPGADQYVKGLTLSNCYYTAPRLSDGNYRMYAYFQPSAGTFKDSISFIHFPASAPSYLDVTVKGGRMTFTKEQYTPNLEAGDWSTDTEEIVVGRPATITCRVTNRNANGWWAGKLYLYCTRSDGTAIHVEGDEPYSIAPGATIEAAFTHTFAMTGEWKSALYADQASISDTKTAIPQTSRSFTVQDDGTGGASFSLTSSPFIIGYADINSTVTFGIPVLNYGRDYHGRLAMLIYQSSPSNPLLTIEGDADMAAGARDTIYVSGTIAGLAQNRAYYGSAHFLRHGEYQFITGTGVSNRVKINVYAEGTHTTDIEDAGTERKAETAIYTIDGRRLTRSNTDPPPLPEGLHITGGRKKLVGKGNATRR